MTNPQYQKLYNVAHRVPTAVSPLLWSIQSLFQSQPSLSVPAAWCIFTSAIDYQTIFDDYSSSPWWRPPPPSLHAPYQDKDQSLPIRGLMEMTNQRLGNCLHGLVIPGGGEK